MIKVVQKASVKLHKDSKSRMNNITHFKLGDKTKRPLVYANDWPAFANLVDELIPSWKKKMESTTCIS